MAHHKKTEITRNSAVLIHQDKAAWGDNLGEIVDVFENVLYKLGETDRKKAQEKAQVLTIELADFWGGKSVYLPIGKKVRIALRNAQVFKDFNGENVPELVKKYHISESTVYSIIREQRRLQKERNDKKYN